MRPNVLTLAFAAVTTSMMGCASDPTVSTGWIDLALSPTTAYQLQNLPTAGTGIKDITSVVVIVKEIDVKVSGSAWTPVLTTPTTIDLYKIDSKTFASLGVTKLPTGHLDEMRLILDEIGDYVVLKDGTKKPLEVPVTGIVKVDGHFDCVPCATGTVIIDFDPNLKTEDEPGRREYELLPTAKIKTAQTKGSCAPLDMSTHDAANPNPDMSMAPCNGACAPTEVCINNSCVANPCAGACAPGEVCDPTTGSCKPASPDMSTSHPDMSTPHHDGGMDGGCKK
jgi:hypothetical protein